MRTKQSLFCKQVFFISFLLFSCMTLLAQNPTNYSGKWEYDKSKSDKEETGNSSFEGAIIMEINQNSSIITFGNTFFHPGIGAG